MPEIKSLKDLRFDNRFVRELPADPLAENRRRQVRKACYSKVRPTPVKAPQLVAYSQDMANRLDLNPQICESKEFLSVFSGNHVLPQMEPYAMCYGGHQFGSWAGQLGDGRAINLGEVVTSQSERWILQLKGSGPTPYSRTADGLAVLRSSVREFLCSEAMYYLEVPTTRALSLILTGERVVRDMFYDGNPNEELGAIVCRTSPSFTRFGNFEIFAANEDKENLEKLVQYTIQNDFPNLKIEDSKDRIIEWYRQVCHRTALMLAHWMRVGFVHGVMNTDNMSILGLTIDYGPYGWVENYDPNWTPNTTDAHGRRYRFEGQANIAHWNLAQLGNVIYMLDSNLGESLQSALNEYPEVFESYWQIMLAQKLGFKKYRKDLDHPLTKELFEILQLTETDMTIFFRNLAKIHPTLAEQERRQILKEAYYATDISPEILKRTDDWFVKYFKRLEVDQLPYETRRDMMNLANPKYVLRNYLAQVAIDRADKGDFSGVKELLELLKNPYTEQKGKEKFAEKRPEWARNRPGCSMLSCSS